LTFFWGDPALGWGKYSRYGLIFKTLYGNSQKSAILQKSVYQNELRFEK